MNKDDMKINILAYKNAYDAALDKFIDYEKEVKNDKYMVVVNYNEPSYRKRLYLIDVENDRLVSSHHVAHGEGSSNSNNRAYAQYFSNKPNSHMTSLGAMVTGQTYIGKHGYSLKLKGLEPGINDNVEKRYIVIHEAVYVTDAYILRNGRAGQSFGCPAVDPAISLGLIDKIKNGCFFYAYYK